MPVKPFTQAQTPGHVALVDDLYEEWIRPNPTAHEPVILEEKDRRNKLVHVYVIWSKWAHLDGIERSEIIMDAAEKKFAMQDLLEITIAMGLTPDEAQGMGIGF
jgi:hypothetical protein